MGRGFFTLLQCTHCRENKNDFAMIKSFGRRKERVERRSRLCPARLQRDRTGHERKKRFRYFRPHTGKARTVLVGEINLDAVLEGSSRGSQDRRVEKAGNFAGWQEMDAPCVMLAVPCLSPDTPGAA